MLPPLASVEDLAVRLGLTLEEDSADYLRAAAVLDDVSALVRLEAGQDYMTVATEEDPAVLDEVPGAIVSVTLQVARRAYMNPDGAAQTSVGDVSASFGGLGRDGAIALTKEERKVVRKAAGRSPVGSMGLESPFTMSTSRDLGWEW